jgi:hypothetical protein
MRLTKAQESEMKTFEDARFAKMTIAERIEWIAQLCISAAVDCSPSKYVGRDDHDTLRELAADAVQYIEDTRLEGTQGMRGASKRQLKAAGTWTDRIIDTIYIFVGVRRPQ